MLLRAVQYYSQLNCYGLSGTDVGLCLYQDGDSLHPLGKLLWREQKGGEKFRVVPVGKRSAVAQTVQL
eukprot:329634-Rhodomonas_salina.2